MTHALRALIISITVLSFFSCEQNPNEQIDEGKVVGNIYTSDEIGWTIEIPADWKVISKDVMNASYEKGKEVIEEVAGEIDMSSLKTLISFQKNVMNNFQSTSQPFEESYEGEWLETNQSLKEIIYEAYANQGIMADTASSKATIDGLEFDVFKSVIYTPDGNILLHQELYSRLINGYDFGMTLTYSNESDKAVMMQAMHNSKFKLRD